MSRDRLELALDHDEAPVIRRNVVGGLTAAGRHEATLEEHLWSLRREAPTGSDTNRHHPVATAIEDLASCVRPDRPGSPGDCELPLASPAGEGLHVQRLD